MGAAGAGPPEPRPTMALGHQEGLQGICMLWRRNRTALDLRGSQKPKEPQVILPKQNNKNKIQNPLKLLDLTTVITGGQDQPDSKCGDFLFFPKTFNCLFCTGVELINDVVVVSGEQRGLSHTYTYTGIHSPLNPPPIHAAM